MPIILIGFQNSGKTSLAKLISKETKQPFFDTDLFLSTKLNKTVRDIYKEMGEKAFRDFEHQALEFAHQNKIQIIATGGGTPIYLPNKHLIKKIGTVFYLNWPFEYLQKRSNHPEFTLNKTLKETFTERKPIYISTCDHVIDMHTYQSINDIKKVILNCSQ